MKPLYPTLCTAALLMLAACTNDLAEDLQHEVPGTGDLPQGTFIVDYTADTDGAQTRADDDTKRPIQSLDYLLYEKTANADAFTLKKHKTLTFDPKTQEWPLTRENLSWEHREALKDTLNTACQYKMVFVANAAASIWNEEVLENVIVGSSTFEDGRLVLPPRVFTENDMYYMWSNHDAPLDGEEYGEGNPAKVAILLERMINKVEVRLDDEWIKTEEELNNVLKEKIDNYYTELTTDEEPRGRLFNKIDEQLSLLAQSLSVGSLWGIYGDACDEVKTFIDGEDFTKEIVNYQLSITFTNKFKAQLFNIYKTQCYWADASIVKIEYENNLFTKEIDFTKTTIASSEAYELSYELKNNAFTYYTFGNNESGENNTLNQVANFIFMDASNQVLTIPGTDLPINDKTGGNNYFKITCNPIGIINDTEDITYTELESINIEEKYGTENWKDLDFGVGNEAGFESHLNNNSGYKNAINNEYVYKDSKITEIYLKFNYPNVTVSPKWERINPSTTDITNDNL